MASDEAVAAASTLEAESATFTLQLVSPSVGIPQPLSLKLPTDITVRQLKERIRNAVSTRPADEAQRLIHRGRLLGRDSETMIEIFGREALQSTDHQTLHLVLRDLSDGRGSSTSTPSNAHQSSTFPRPPVGNHVPPQQYAQHHATSTFNQPQPQPQPHVRVGVPHYHGVAFGLPQGMPIPGQIPGAMIIPTNMQPQQYGQWMRTMNAQGGAPNQNQRMAAQGAQEPSPANFRGTPGTNTPGRTASPLHPMDATRTTVREGVGPNGMQWRVTMNETFINPMQRPGRTESPFSTADASNLGSAQPRSAPNGGSLFNNEVQNFLRSADASSATRVMTDAMRRNASNSSLANLASSQAHHPIAPGVTTPLIPSRAGSANATPDPFRAFGQTRPVSTSQTQTQSSQGTPEVYILSSPSGPRGILLNNNLETYFTPQVRTVNQPFGLSVPQRPLPNPFVNPFHLPHLTPTPTVQPVGRHMTGPQPNNGPQPPPPQQQHGLPQPPQHQPQPQIGHAVARADNPQVQAIRLAQLWPHVWMIIRLGVFIWLFTSPASSWSRWFTAIAIAIVLFLINTGLLNPLGEHIWVPFRRQLDNLIANLIALADGHQDAQAPARAGNAQGGNDVDAANPGQRQGEPNPADTAARLVQQRRNANANWLMDQVRRLERAGILFLASIAPGVAERHIAQIEADARAEQRRREAEAAAAAAATEQPQDSEGQPQNTENNEGESSSRNPGEQNQVAEEDRNRENNERLPVEEEPLIAL
ncbi:hypothetical protein F5Y06DRAFT_175230 [Hypoxylon sp. FL0890]|nr:hypothetical protein F5Y06DRAFT_175230 [Hypoxylon sp. FL0890]